jgi:hypothetical protein
MWSVWKLWWTLRAAFNRSLRMSLYSGTRCFCPEQFSVCCHILLSSQGKWVFWKMLFGKLDNICGSALFHRPKWSQEADEYSWSIPQSSHCCIALFGLFFTQASWDKTQNIPFQSENRWTIHNSVYVPHFFVPKSLKWREGKNR